MGRTSARRPVPAAQPRPNTDTVVVRRPCFSSFSWCHTPADGAVPTTLEPTMASTARRIRTRAFGASALRALELA
jgi:hypothetical protein